MSLTNAGVNLLVDVRAVAMSRRPGFAKSALRANLESAGIRYLHLRQLGTPSDGRVAARAGRHEEMHAIFREQLATEGAQDELQVLADLVRGSQKIALLCFEAEASVCHRAIVADAIAELAHVDIVNLAPDVGESD
ncbi:MAG: DUF488 family protein [Gemmatimonas sp.]